MNRDLSRTLIWIFAFIALILGLFVQKVLSPKQLTPEQYRQLGAIVFEKPRVLKEFSLIDHQGADFTLQNLTGHWTVMTFGFTHCPDICPTNLSVMNQVAKKLENTEWLEDTEFVMLTVDPERDTREVLGKYVPYFNESFVGLTGELKAIAGLAGNMFIAFNKVPGTSAENYNVDHSGDIAIINPYGHYHAVFRHPHDAEKIATAYESMRNAFE